MEESGNKLIQELVAKHRPRPWWKNPIILFGMWFISHFVYFLGLGLLKADILQLRSSAIYLFLTSVGVFVSGAVFIHVSRHTDLRESFFQIWMTVFILWIGIALFIESQVMGTVLHARNVSVTHGDFACFWHSVASTIGPVLLFPIIFKQYFVSRPKWAVTFMSIHLAFMGSLLTELKCPDRELWHLLLGHQTTFFGVAVLLMLATYFGRKLNFLKA